MMVFFQVCSTVVLCCGLLLLFSTKERELLSLLSAMLLLFVLLYAVSRFGTLSEFFKDFTLSDMPLGIGRFLPICGVALGGAAASAICDAIGQKSMGGALELLTVLEVLLLAFPLLRELCEKALNLLGG